MSGGAIVSMVLGQQPANELVVDFSRKRHNIQSLHINMVNVEKGLRLLLPRS